MGSITIETPTADDIAAMTTLDARTFGNPPLNEAQIEASFNWMSLDRTLIAKTNGRVVAMAATVPFELTLPGLAVVPLSGVTWVSVDTTQTRRGILGRLMAGLDELAVAASEPVLGLQASEGGIYERFGYGASTFCRVVEIDRRQAKLDPRHGADRAAVTLMRNKGNDEATAHRLTQFDQHRRSKPGEVSMAAAYDALSASFASDKTVFAHHRDGFAMYAVEPDWAEGHPRHTVTVSMLVANTEQAHLDLWDTILNIDLAATIRVRDALGLDDPLPYLLTNPRTVRTVELNDFTWLKVLDAERLFSARTYRTTDELVLQIEGDPRALAIGNQGATRSDNTPDLTVAPSALGPLLLGGVSASRLAAGRRLTGSAEALQRADAFFGCAPAPHSQLHI